MAQNKLEKRKAQKERSSLVSSMMTVAKAAVKRPLAGLQSQAKRPCHQSKPSASGKAVDNKGKGKPYFPPSSKAKVKGKGKGKKTEFSWPINCSTKSGPVHNTCGWEAPTILEELGEAQFRPVHRPVAETGLQDTI
jgi:hypothetical protein